MEERLREWLTGPGCDLDCQFPPKNCSAEDRIEGLNVYFRRNSGCSAEQKTLGIQFLNPSAERKKFRTRYRWTEIEANFRNFVPEHFSEEKTARNFRLGIFPLRVPNKSVQARSHWFTCSTVLYFAVNKRTLFLGNAGAAVFFSWQMKVSTER